MEGLSGSCSVVLSSSPSMAYGFGFLPDLENSKSVYPPSLTSEIASVLSPSDIKSHFHILLPLNRDSSGTRQASRVSLLGIEEEGRTSYQEGGDIQQIHELLSPLLSLRLVTTGMCESQPLPFSTAKYQHMDSL